MNNGKYCPEIVEEICKNIELGLTAKDACTYSSISQETYYSWIRNHPEFMQAIKTAQLNLKRQMLAVVKKAAVTHWQAAMTLLERKFPDEFAQRTKQEITGYLAKSEDEADKKARLSRVTKRINEMLEEKLLEGPQEQPAVVQNSEQILP